MSISADIGQPVGMGKEPWSLGRGRGSTRNRRLLPGLRLALAWTLIQLGVLVLIPITALFYAALRDGLGGIPGLLWSPRTLAAFRLSFGLSLLAAFCCIPLGLLIAWVLGRYRFPGRLLVDAMVDLPFALPTAVSGITLTYLYSPQGWLGRLLVRLGIQVAFTPLGIFIALVFIGLPFVVRAAQPVIEDLEPELEEAAISLGASRLQTFVKVILPSVLPAVWTGFALAFARAVGEYGSVIFIAGNMPMKTEIVPLLIVTHLEQFDYRAAAVLGTGMLLVSFVMLFLINRLQRRVTSRGFGA